MERKNLTYDSRIRDLYQNPVGHDALARVLLQLGLPEQAVTNPAVANLKLRTVAGLTKKKLGTDFFDALLHLVNLEQDEPCASTGEITPRWWKEAVFYQIYPRSFCDSNGDGIGDLPGILSKLDYLKELGVDALWLSPIYDSPNDDNGYDIRDYDKIMAEFGTMEDFERLLDGVHARGMRLIMDLVVNHTSDEHAWYQQALADENSPYREYYFFRKDDGSHTPPNNWTSFFSGPAWNYVEEGDCWALHLFSKKQMDLNWDNPDVRRDVIAMVNRWLDRGVDGFRMDVINYISKEDGLPQGNETIGALMGFPGIERYYYGPHLHEYLREIREQAFEPHGAFSVGETPGLGMKMAQLVTGEERRELDMIFSFDHLETPGHTRFDDYEYDLNYFRDYMIDWMEHYGSNCWMSLFYNNHDNPRMISKITGDISRHTALSKLLAVMQMTLKGTPFVFQGDEMGLANYPFTSMEQITDVEAKGYYAEHIETESKDKVFATILAGTREHARVLLPWNEKLPPWHRGLRQQPKAEVEEAYRELIRLRHEAKALVYGTFRVRSRKKDRFVYERELDGQTYLVDCNLGAASCKAFPLEGRWELVYDTQAKDGGRERLQGGQARIWKKAADTVPSR
ncbi:MAG: alpha-glucosidase [Oscillospiraceae bacterium]|nr:alpha-glucosidase [Oscillospiraceae bacterium]